MVRYNCKQSVLHAPLPIDPLTQFFHRLARIYKSSTHTIYDNIYDGLFSTILQRHIVRASNIGVEYRRLILLLSINAKSRYDWISGNIALLLYRP